MKKSNFREDLREPRVELLNFESNRNAPASLLPAKVGSPLSVKECCAKILM